MTLQGALDTFPLPDVLRLLAATGKTGGLHVAGPVAGGVVWLVDGEVEHAVVGGVPCDPAAAVFRLLRNVEGTFRYEPGVPDIAPSADGPASVEAVLADATVLLQEWDDLSQVVPGADARLTLQEVGDDDVHLTGEEWRVVVAVGGGCSVMELAESLGASDLDAMRLARDLAVAGLVAAVPSPVPDDDRLGEDLRAAVVGPAAVVTPPAVVAPAGPAPVADAPPSSVWGADGLPVELSSEPVRIRPGSLAEEDWAEQDWSEVTGHPSVRAAALATPAPEVSTPAAPEEDGDEELDRTLLLRFLGSVEG